MGWAQSQPAVNLPNPGINRVLFQNVRVFDGTSPRLSGPTNVLVIDNKIERISTSPIPIPADLRTLLFNGEGKVLMPGLIDAHVHVFMEGVAGQAALFEAGTGGEALVQQVFRTASESANRLLLNGFTGVRDLAGPVFELKKAIDQGQLLGPRIWPSGAMISQTSGHGDYRTLDELPRTPTSELSLAERYGVGAIAQTLSLATLVAAILGVAPARATELRPSAPDSAESTRLDAKKSLALARVAEDKPIGELHEPSKFSSIDLPPDRLSFSPPQSNPGIVADAQIDHAPAESPPLEPQSSPSARLLLDELPAEAPSVDESALAQTSFEPLNEPSEPGLEPVDLPEQEPADLPGGEFESEEFFEGAPSDPFPSALDRASPRRRWQVTVEPYFFIPLEVRADILVLGRSTSIRADLDDFLNLDRAFDGGLRVDAQNGRFGILLDGFYLSLAQGGTLPVTFPAGSLLRFGIPFEVEGRADASASLRQGKIDLSAYFICILSSG